MKCAAKRTFCALLSLVLVCGLAACGGAKAVDPKTCTYDEMVDYLTAKGYIPKDATPVDMLTTEGYLTDNTGGEIPFAPFADKAQEEGFSAVAAAFRQIARIEKVHADRFKRFAQLMEQGKLFVSDVETEWMCLNCGHVQKGTKAPEQCPMCKHSQGYFIRFELSPFEK